VANHVTLPAAFTLEEDLDGQVVIPANQPIPDRVPASWRHSPWLVIGGVIVCMLVIGGIVLASGQPRSQPAFIPGLPSPVVLTLATVATQSPVIATQPHVALSTASLVPTSVPTQAPAPQSSWEQGRIVYIVRNDRKLNDITMQEMSANAVPRLLLPSQAGQLLYGPSFSHDSSKVVYYDANRGDDGILDVQTHLFDVFPACNSPSFSTDGSRIICGQGSQFKFLDASGKPAGTLDVEPSSKLPALSPDGSEVAFAVLNGNSTSIWKISSSGGQAVQLASQAIENYAPSWSPDGQWIAYQSGEGVGPDDIWVMDQNGGNKQQITHIAGKFSRGPVWSPDGKWLAFISNKDASVGSDFGDVYVVSLNTGDLIQVTYTGGRVLDWRVSWSP